MQQVREAHQREFEASPQVMVVAPGRIHIAGEHSWFFKDKTLSMAINLPVYIAVSLRKDSALRFYFVQSNERKRANITSLKYKREDKWANAIKAVISGFLSMGFTCQGMNVTIWSEILPSAGFGVTTAIKSAFACAVRHLLDLKCSDMQLMQILEKGNRQFLNTENYIADSFTSLYSKENTLVLTDYSKYEYETIPFNFTGKTILVTDAKVPRISVWNESSIHQAENALLLGELKEPKANAYGGWLYESSPTEINEVLSVVHEDVRHRLLYIMKEHSVVLSAVDGLKTNNFGEFAKAINYSHENLRDLYEISCPEIDWIYKRIIEISQISDVHVPSACCRITGKGFGRCAYVILNTEDVPLYKKKLADYDRIFGFQSSTYEVKPSSGIRIVE